MKSSKIDEKVAKTQMLKKWGLPRKNQFYKTALFL